MARELKRRTGNMNVGSNSSFKFEMPSWLDTVTKNPNGSSTIDKGMFSYGGDIMEGIMGWKGLGLQEEAFEEAKKNSAFAKKEYWTDLAMNRDLLNRKINNKSALNQMYRNINAGRPGDGEALGMKYNGDNAGAGIINTDGSMHNVVNIPQEHLSSSYAQMTPGPVPIAGNSAFAQPAVPGVSPLTAPPKAIGTSAYAKTAQPVKQTTAAPSNGQTNKKLT